ncbi:MAG TPA: hypothetical protein VMT08_20455 [Bradyrhizobium sp.]|nr:hypothetical protein [Bradyrhizobium sp.]
MNWQANSVEPVENGSSETRGSLAEPPTVGHDLESRIRLKAFSNSTVLAAFEACHRQQSAASSSAKSSPSALSVNR